MTTLTRNVIQHLAAAGSLVSLTLGVSARTVTGVAGPTDLCGAPPRARVERAYVLSARIRPFLIWIGHREVGDARLSWLQSGDDGRRFELLIGTDPNRTPMHVNRWGYLVETTCGPRTEFLGVMTESSEETIAEARSNVASNGTGHSFRAMRGTIIGSEARAEVMHVTPQEVVTYRDLAALLGRLPSVGVERRAVVQPDMAPGFLHAVVGLMNESVRGRQRSGRASDGFTRAYVYGDRVFDITLREASDVADLRAAGRVFMRPIHAGFEVRNRQTREVTAFQITFATDHDVVGVPLRVAFRPRWWLQLEMDLAEPASSMR